MTAEKLNLFQAVAKSSVFKPLIATHKEGHLIRSVINTTCLPSFKHINQLIRETPTKNNSSSRKNTVVFLKQI